MSSTGNNKKIGGKIVAHGTGLLAYGAAVGAVLIGEVELAGALVAFGQGCSAMSNLSKAAAPMLTEDVPTLSAWRQNCDGSVTGSKTGSSKQYTTSPIVSGTIAAGEVVTTKNGSRYFLEKPVPTLSAWRKNCDGSMTGFITGSNKYKPGEKLRTSPIASGTIAWGEVVTATSGSRYYLDNPAAPEGVPTLSAWRNNWDGTLTGIVTGSNNFRLGEKMTTSQIASGTVASGEVVTTESGSRYYLA